MLLAAAYPDGAHRHVRTRMSVVGRSQLQWAPVSSSTASVTVIYSIDGSLWSLLNACIDLINQQDRQPRSQHQLRSNGHVTWEGGWETTQRLPSSISRPTQTAEPAAPSKSPTDGQSMPEVPPHAAPEPPPPSVPRPVAWLKSPQPVSLIFQASTHQCNVVSLI